MVKTRAGTTVRPGKSGKLVMSVPEAGAKLGLSREASYDAARRGDLPVLRIGRLLKVPIVAFDRLLAGVGK
jgi:Helix-turn-helix domain